MKGAPIRFVASVLGGWTCIRITMLLPGDSPLEIAADVLAPPAAAATAATEHRPSLLAAPEPGRIGPATIGRQLQMREPATGASDRATTYAHVSNSAGRAVPTTAAPATQAVQSEQRAMLVRPGVGSTPEQGHRRLGVSAWLLARGGANGTLSGGMLGGSQAGARLTYSILPDRRIALSARIAAPLRGRGAEAAVGVDWQPTRAPVHLLAEQRFGIDGARGGPTVMAIAGLNPTSVAAGFRLEAYAQGGAIWRGGQAEAFGDGAARLTRPVVTLDGMALDAGAGVWAAGQRGATRIDVGPTVGMALPLAGRRVRISADWRQRIAGDARPGSGPALSLGTDF